MVIVSVLVAAAWLPTVPERLGPAAPTTVDRYLLWRGDYDRTPKVPPPLILDEPLTASRRPGTGRALTLDGGRAPADRPFRLERSLRAMQRER